MTPRWQHWTAGVMTAVALHMALAAVAWFEQPPRGTAGRGTQHLEVALGGAVGGPPSEVPTPTPGPATQRSPAETAQTREPTVRAAPRSQSSRTIEAVTPKQSGQSAPAARTPQPPQYMAEVAEHATAESRESREPLEQATTKPAEPSDRQHEARREPPRAAAEAPATHKTKPPREITAERAPAQQPSSRALPPAQGSRPTAKPVDTRKASLVGPTAAPSEADAEIPARTARASALAAGEGSGNQRESAQGSGSQAIGGGRAGAQADYISRLRALLARHKNYPRRARMRRREGTAMLRLSIERDGRVSDYGIVESSGHRSLDAEVRAMVERSQPLPGIPPEVGRERLTLIIPVRFSLRR